MLVNDVMTLNRDLNAVAAYMNVSRLMPCTVCVTRKKVSRDGKHLAERDN
jgi:hypothetical protein